MTTSDDFNAATAQQQAANARLTAVTAAYPKSATRATLLAAMADERASVLHTRAVYAAYGAEHPAEVAAYSAAHPAEAAIIFPESAPTVPVRVHLECPVCYAPNASHTEVCPYCKNNLIVT